MEPLIRQSIPEGIDPPASQLPRRLDKPVYLASSKSYADVLKKQFSHTPNSTTTATDTSRPPRKRQAAVIDYDSDSSTHATETTMSTNSNGSTQSNTKQPTANTTSNESAAELLSIKQELTALRTMITTAVEQFKAAIATLATATPTQSPMSTAMDTEVDTSTMHHHNTKTNTDLADVIQDLKYEIATIITETQAMFQQQLFCAGHQPNHPSSVT